MASELTPEQWERVREVFEQAQACAPEERAQLLHTACGADTQLRAAVERLLQVQEQAAQFLEPPPAAQAATIIGRRLGPYRVLSELGQGGMSTVYLAVRADDAYQQQVALKLLWPGSADTQLIRRFERERQILADLAHPNIARLLDGGMTAEGWPYLVMEYVDGAPLTEYCAAQRLPLRARLQLFQTVCAAVEYAHQHLVVHRDLKPGNILVTMDGAPKLLDFGIAKLLKPDGQAENTDLTRTGLHLLTPDYASPEQIRREEITAASDVYSLGVLLYELLTGVRPYHLASPLLHEITRAICEVEPEAPSRRLAALARAHQIFIVEEPEALRRQVRGDLDQIVLTALAKEPSRRYQSVAALSADLAHYLAGQPVSARKPTLGYRAGKLIGRHRAAALAVAVSALGALLLALWQLAAARQSERRARPQLYAARIQQAANDYAAGDLARMQQTLASLIPKPGAEERRGFEYRYLQRLARRELLTLPHQQGVFGANFLPDEKLIYTGNGTFDSVKLWDAATGQERATLAEPGVLGQLHFQDKRTLRIKGEGQSVKTWDFFSGQLLADCVDPSANFRWVSLPVWSKRMFTMSHDGVVKQWEPLTCRSLVTLKVSLASIAEDRLTDDGRCLLAIQRGGQTAELWDMARARRITTLRWPLPYSSQFTADDSRLFGVILDRQIVHLYEWATGRLRATLHAGTPAAGLNYAVFSPDHSRLATYGEGPTVRIWDTATGGKLAELAANTDDTYAAVFLSDGRMLATANNDGTLRLWDLTDRRELAAIKAHGAEINSIAASRDGRRLITSSNDRTAKVWEVQTLLEPQVFSGHQSRVFAVAFAPDGRRLATASHDRTAKIWDIATGQPLLTLTGHGHQVLAVAFSPDGRLLATGCWDGVARLWDAATGKLLRSFTMPEEPAQIRTVAFSPDGRTLAVAGEGRTIRFWDVASGAAERVFSGHVRGVFSIAYAPDGRLLASGSEDGALKLWNIATGQLLATLNAHEAAVWSVRFSPDGKQLATGSRDRTAKLWELATRRLLRTCTGHTDEIFSLAFTPDGARLATASNDHTIKLWETATGLELLTLREHTDQVWSVAFAPDGQTLASGSWDKTARLWRAGKK